MRVWHFVENSMQYNNEMLRLLDNLLARHATHQNIQETIQTTVTTIETTRSLRYWWHSRFACSRRIAHDNGGVMQTY